MVEIFLIDVYVVEKEWREEGGGRYIDIICLDWLKGMMLCEFSFYIVKNWKWDYVYEL